jgi:glycosyltransferase involved in cell wall biosynthesis
LREIAAVTSLGRQLHDWRFDAAFTYTPKVNIYFGLNAKALPLGHVPNVSGLGRAFISPTWYRPVVKRLYRAAFERALAVVFQNDDDRQAFDAMGLVRPEQVVRVPGSGVDLARFAPAPLPPGDDPIFLFVGRVLRDKGVLELIEAMRLLRARRPGAKLRLLGSVGANNPTAISIDRVHAWQAQGLVELLGSTDDVRPMLTAAHCVVLPSYREGVTRALLEAAAMARPCIATDVPGCRDAVVHGQTGFLCRARDARALADAMLEFAAWQTLGQAGRRLVEQRFDERIVLERYLGLARRMSGQSAVPAPSATQAPFSVSGSPR